MARTDEELAAAALSGDPQAFEALVQKYQRLVFNIVYHYLGKRNEVEDIAQEVFLKVYRSLSRYDTGRPFKAWISRITVNCCLDELRKSKRKPQLFSDLSEEEGLDSYFDRFAAGSSLSEAEAERMLELLQTQISRLSDKDRMAFVLREIEGFAYQDIAEAMETTELAARIRVSRSRRRLLELLDKAGVISLGSDQ